MQIRLVALSIVLVGTACGGDGNTSTTTTASAPTTVLAPEGYPVTDVSDRLEARLELISPDWLVADETNVWAKRDDGGVERLDPETNEIAQTYENDGAHCAGIGIGYDAVWTCSGSNVVRLDRTTGEVVATLPLVQTATQGHLATGFGLVWVLTGDGSTLVGIDPETNAASVTADLGVRATDVKTGEAGLWVVSTLDDQVLKVDPDSGELLLRVTEVVKPVALSITRDVWVGAQLSTSRLDPASGEVLVTSEIGTGANGSVAATDDDVWVRSADRFLVRLDPKDGRPVEGISSPDTPSAGDMLLAFGSLWTTAYDDGTLFRLSL